MSEPLPPLRARMKQIVWWLIPIVTAVVVIDQYTKSLIEHSLQPFEIVPVIDGFFNLTLYYNRGAAFGMFHSLPDGTRQLVLWGVSTLAVSAVLFFLIREYHAHRVGKMSLSLILGGAIGNGIDRANRGEVVDFLDFYVGSYHWPAFNVADSAITVGAVILVLVTLLESRRAPESARKSRVES